MSFNYYDLSDNGENINIKVMSPNGGSILFTYPVDDSLEKLMNTYSKRQCVHSSQLKYKYKNDEIYSYNTPLQLKMINNSVIHSQLVQ